MKQRFQVLSHFQPDEAAEREQRDPLVQLCAFFVGPEEYAVDIMRVEELLPPQRLTPIRGAPPCIEGILQLRGSVIPVLDLRKLLLGPDAPAPTKTRLLVCMLGLKRVALAVDRVSEVVRLRRSEIKPAPAIGAVGPAPFVVGVCGKPERPKLLLDVKALLLAELVRDTGRRMPG